MYLKQELKQKINLALSKHRFSYRVLDCLEQEWYCIAQQQKMRKGRGCTHVHLQRGNAMLRNIKETGAYLSVSRSTVYRLIKDGTLQVVYVRGLPRITQQSLSELAGGRNG